MMKRHLVKVGDKKQSGSPAQKSTSGSYKSKDASVDNELRTGALKDDDMRKVSVGESEGEESAVIESGRSKDVPLDHKAIGKKVAKQSNTLKDSNVDDDLKLGVLKDKVTRAVSGGKSMGKKSGAGESKARGKAKLVEEKQDAEINMMEEGHREGTPVEEEDTPTPVRRKRGADGKIVQEFWSSLERGSSRLRPRKEVPVFRLVDLEDDDNNRIIGKRVKVYWSGSRKWFTGHIEAFDYEKKLHDILYEDGDREMLDLRKERFELEIMPTECFKLRTKQEKNVKDLDGEKVSAETLKDDIKMVDAEKGAKESEPEKITPSDMSLKDKTDPEVKNEEELVEQMGVDVIPEKAKEMVIDEAHDDDDDEIDNVKNVFIDVNKSVDVNYQEDGKINSLAEEKGGISVEAQHSTLDSNVEKKGDDHLEKQNEIVDNSKSEDTICMDGNLTRQKTGKAKKAKDNKMAESTNQYATREPSRVQTQQTAGV